MINLFFKLRVYFGKFIYLFLAFLLNFYDGLIMILLSISKFRPCSVKTFDFVTKKTFIFCKLQCKTKCKDRETYNESPKSSYGHIVCPPGHDKSFVKSGF